jgi:mono/diheme cytochrome c family protein
MTFPMKTVQFILAMIGLLTMLVGIAAAIFFFGGFYDVAANHPDPHIVDWALVRVRMASVTRHATDRPPAGTLDDPAVVQKGAVIYARNGCTNCHGEPGVESAKFSEGMNPPPDLRKVVTKRTPEEMFWVIKNGIKMSAMPSFGVDKPPVDNRNIWAVVAYLKKLSSVSDPNFKAWTQTPIGGHWVTGCGPGRAAGCGPGRK